MRSDKPSYFTQMICLIILFSTFAPQHAWAENDRLVFGTVPDGWPPFIIPVNGSGDCVGIMPDIFKEVCAKINMDIDVHISPEKRTRRLLDEGGVDVFPLSIRWVDDPTNYLWSLPVMPVEDIIVYRKDSPITYNKPHDLAGMNVGVIHGYVYPTLDKLFETGTVHRHTAFNTRNLLFMLARKHVDAIVSTPHVARWILSIEPKLNAEDFAFCRTPVDSAPYAFAFTKTKEWRPFITKFNAELEAMRQDGRLDTILQKYR